MTFVWYTYTYIYSYIEERELHFGRIADVLYSITKMRTCTQPSTMSHQYSSIITFEYECMVYGEKATAPPPRCIEWCGNSIVECDK